MSKRYSGKSFKDSSVMKKPKLSLKEKRKLKKKEEQMKGVCCRVPLTVTFYCSNYTSKCINSKNNL